LTDPDEPLPPRSVVAEIIGILVVALALVAIQLATGLHGLFAAALVVLAAGLGVLALLRRC